MLILLNVISLEWVLAVDTSPQAPCIAELCAAPARLSERPKLRCCSPGELSAHRRVGSTRALAVLNGCQWSNPLPDTSAHLEGSAC
eukprot:2842584-Rhodomonas_salina.2